MAIRKLANAKLWAAAAALSLCGSLALAQTLPLPAPGTNPTTPPGGAGDAAAKARAAALAAKANVDVAEAWTRATTNATNAPVYLHIVSAKDPDRLISIDTAMAKSVELREDVQGQSRPVLAPAIDIPGGATINLGPGGKYLMLVGLKQPLREGDSFLITLHFDKAGTESAAVKILGTGAASYPATATGRRNDTTAAATGAK
jgi:copper(I)-binding protein